jgi:hypothetical protein
LVKVFESIIVSFYSPLLSKLLPTKPVAVNHVSEDPNNPTNPTIYRNDVGDRIYLTPVDKRWDQLSYQFSHELCHHVFNTPDDNNDPYGWLEESFCELASIIVLRNMADRWKNNPPYSNWKNYSKVLKNNVDGVTNDISCQINIPFSTWLSDNFQDLKTNRYDRARNKTVALKLLPHFEKDPYLWRIIHFYRNVSYSGKTTMEEFLCLWKEQLTNDLKGKFKIIEVTFLAA